MASSNRHWPSLFKSKPCNTPHHQWQHDINSSSLLSGGCQKPSYAPAPGCEERSPEPKPRWNPKPEQIRILEAIFNSGMVNPPRDEIRRIRAQLQEYGQVGDANVFYWFQNRKSRSKHKNRHLLAARTQPRSAASSPLPAATSSSSSSGSTGSDKIPPPVSSVATAGAINVSGSPTTSVNQTYFHGPVEFYNEPLILQGPQGYYISASDLPGIFSAAEQGTGVNSGLWGELMGQEVWKSTGVDEDNIKTAAVTTSVFPAVGTATSAVTGTSVATPVNEIIQGLGVAGGVSPARLTVFINDVAFEVGSGQFNVRESFGEEAVLLHSSGHPVLVDEWGVTFHPLQDGASYYLV